MIVGHCSFSGCSNPEIHDYQTRVYAVRGYEETRTQGGQNHVLRKERVDGWVWHRHCWETVMHHHDGTGKQSSLFDGGNDDRPLP